ncbi:hypothetical protein V499_00520 [Pseudogymnoascus sp. VKM F-103]|nr:hypothetical protein V499_00520 [Pseudogymnoascus sp. VKM F-103]
MSEQASPIPPSPLQSQSQLSTTTTTTMPSPAPSSADLTHFLTHPWCAALLSAPNTTLLPTPSRVPKKSTEDSFFAVTLRTGDTIPFMLSFSSPRPVAAASSQASDGVAAASSAPAPAAPAPGTSTEQVSTLFALEAGLNGYPLTAHGGLISALFDEAMEVGDAGGGGG